MWLALCRTDDSQVQRHQETSTRQRLVEKTMKIWWHAWIQRSPAYHWSSAATNRQLTMHPNRTLNHRNPLILAHYHMSSEKFHITIQLASNLIKKNNFSIKNLIKWNQLCHPKLFQIFQYKIQPNISYI